MFALEKAPKPPLLAPEAKADVVGAGNAEDPKAGVLLVDPKAGVLLEDPKAELVGADVEPNTDFGASLEDAKLNADLGFSSSFFGSSCFFVSAAGGAESAFVSSMPPRPPKLKEPPVSPSLPSSSFSAELTACSGFGLTGCPKAGADEPENRPPPEPKMDPEPESSLFLAENAPKPPVLLLLLLLPKAPKPPPLAGALAFSSLAPPKMLPDGLSALCLAKEPNPLPEEEPKAPKPVLAGAAGAGVTVEGAADEGDPNAEGWPKPPKPPELGLDALPNALVCPNAGAVDVAGDDVEAGVAGLPKALGWPNAPKPVPDGFEPKAEVAPNAGAGVEEVAAEVAAGVEEPNAEDCPNAGALVAGADAEVLAGAPKALL